MRYDAHLPLLFAPLMLVTSSLPTDALGEELPRVVRDTFSAAPDWEGFRNRLRPEHPSIVRQDFGYRGTNNAGGRAAGEIGGTVQRSPSPAFYALKIRPKSLDDRLSASGVVSVPKAGGGSGVMIGWFGAPPPSWRTPNSLAFRIDGNGGKFWMFYEYGTSKWRTGGGGAFAGEQYQRTSTLPFPADGKPHQWSLDYDPAGASGRGLVTFQVDDRKYALALGKEHRQDGAVLDHFGIWNVQTPGDQLEVYLDDLVVDGRKLSFDENPDWDAMGNDVEFAERLIRPYHDFGFSPTSHAGGAPGEIGGIVFRDEQPTYYAARVGRLTLDDELQASGKLALRMAASDSGVYLGWFNAESKQSKSTPDYESPQNNFLGVLIEGPSRAGHYFRPAYGCSAGRGQIAGEKSASGESWPVIFPNGASHAWALHYRPEAAGAGGQIEITFDGHTDVLDLKPGDRAAGAMFNRFGIFNMQSGGHGVDIYLDDVSYTRR